MSDDVKDYTNTLNLPKTDFPMKANLAALEPKMLAFWEAQNVFQSVLIKNSGKPEFVLHDGPPYANGHLHAGHALNKVLKDIVVKFQNLAGKRADFVPGWDCHGLPIEQAVEKRLREEKVDRKSLSTADFLERCRSYALEYVSLQREEFKRLGVLAQWNSPYLTLDAAYEARELRELAAFAERGSVYRQNKPVLWCVYDRTALALAEIEYEDLEVPSVYVAFSLVSDVSATWSLLAGRSVSLAIWTTTPWTLPANRAIAVHPDLEYVFYDLGERVVCVAKELLPRFLEACRPEHLKTKAVTVGDASFDTASLTEATRILAFCSGYELEGLKYKHVLSGLECSVVLAEHVTLEAGTGLVHTAPGHGPDDYAVGLKYGLEPYSPVLGDGRYDDTVGPSLVGKQVFEANDLIPRMLAEAGVLLNEPGQTITTSYPHSWRSRKPVIYRATPQWFISMEHNGLREKALACIDEEINWVPSWGRDRIHGMLSTRPDWTISRQRAWGVPIPAAVCASCQRGTIEAEVVRAVAEAVEREGLRAWHERPLAAFRAQGDVCPHCGAGALVKETDILDVWFDSACSFSNPALRNSGAPFQPFDLYLEGSDQHRGWFHSSLLVGVGTRGTAPYKTCLTHGFVVDGKGEKMSKSKGNVVAPDEITSKFGAEVLRLWVAASDYRDDVRLSKQILEGLAESYRKIRNTLRYALSNLWDFEPARDTVQTLEPLDQWVSARLDALLVRVRQAYEAYEFHVVVHAIVDFCAGPLSSVYFDVQKDNLYTNSQSGSARRSTQTVLHRIASDLLVMLAPIASFTAEEAWQALPGRSATSVFLADFPRPRAAHDAAVVEDIEGLVQVREVLLPLLETARREKRIGKSEEAALALRCTGPTAALLSRHRARFAELMKVSEVQLDSAAALTEVQAHLFASVVTPSGAKCPRCWLVRVEVEREGLCARCSAVVGAVAQR